MSAVLESPNEFFASDDKGAGMPCSLRLIDAIGRKDFASELLKFFENAFDAEHCAVFQLDGYELTELCAAIRNDAAPVTKSDLTLYEIKRRLRQMNWAGPHVVTYPIGVAPRKEGVGKIARQGLMIAGQRSKGQYCIRIVMPLADGSLFETRIDRLREMADLLISVVARHVDLTCTKSDVTPALMSLDEIEACLFAANRLSRRECEVCARILFGYSSSGIALDLDIGKESVMTYRKRAYHRLGIGSQRELLMWYLNLWSEIPAKASSRSCERTLAFSV